MIRDILSRLRLLRLARSLRHLIFGGSRPVGQVFMPCTPHLLVAVSKALRWCQENKLDDQGDYFEFGIFRGFTLWYAQALALCSGIEKMRFFGFDSFQGLSCPRGVDAGHEFREGAYCCGRKEVEAALSQHGTDWSRTFLVEGWYKDTLVDRTVKRFGLKGCVLCVIDCDLYESTQLALEFIRPLLLDRSVTLFDDWNNFGGSPQLGEQRAFSEFLTENTRIKAEPFIEFGSHGKGFTLSQIRLPSIPLQSLISIEK